MQLTVEMMAEGGLLTTEIAGALLIAMMVW
jgi:hypothetical protein